MFIITGYWTNNHHSPSPVGTTETKLVNTESVECQIGGLLLWVSDDTYLSFANRAPRMGEIRLEICKQGQYEVVGRGRLSGQQIYLRLERSGKSVATLCSSDGKKWQSCGEASFPEDDPAWIGIYAGCLVGFDLPPSIVHFQEFKLFRQKAKQ